MASYEVLLDLFERVQFLLQRLNRYMTVHLTPDMTLLLGKIMAQILIVLAFSTKEMKERRISMYFRLVLSESFVVDYWTEKILKRIVGKTDLEDALQRLDVLTKEENLMTAARNLEVTHRVDNNVTELTRIIHENVRVTHHGVQRSLDIFIHVVTTYARHMSKQQWMNKNVRHFLTFLIPIFAVKNVHR